MNMEHIFRRNRPTAQGLPSNTMLPLQELHRNECSGRVAGRGVVVGGGGLSRRRRNQGCSSGCGAVVDSMWHHHHGCVALPTPLSGADVRSPQSRSSFFHNTCSSPSRGFRTMCWFSVLCLLVKKETEKDHCPSSGSSGLCLRWKGAVGTDSQTANPRRVSACARVRVRVRVRSCDASMRATRCTAASGAGAVAGTAHSIRVPRAAASPSCAHGGGLSFFVVTFCVVTFRSAIPIKYACLRHLDSRNRCLFARCGPRVCRAAGSMVADLLIEPTKCTVWRCQNAPIASTWRGRIRHGHTDIFLRP